MDQDGKLPTKQPLQPTSESLGEGNLHSYFDSKLNKEFGDRVRTWRLRREWSQERLAQELAITTGHAIELHPTSVTRLEKGDRPTTYSESIALALMILDSGEDQATFLGIKYTDERSRLEQLVVDHERYLAKLRSQRAQLNRDMNSLTAEIKSRQAELEKTRRQLAQAGNG